RSGAGPTIARAGEGQLLPPRALVGRHPGDRVRAFTSGQPEGPDRFEHDGEHSGLQRVRAEGADAANGPEGAGGGEGARGEEAVRQSTLYGTSRSALLRRAPPPHAARPVAGSGEPRVCPSESRDLRADAGTERDGRERKAGKLGSLRRLEKYRHPNARRRSQARHDGPELHGDDVEAGAEGTVSVLSERQPHGDVRRPADLLQRTDQVRGGCRRSTILKSCQACWTCKSVTSDRQRLPTKDSLQQGTPLASQYSVAS